MSAQRRGELLRERGEDASEVQPIELFFDLVYVLAITQLTHHLLEHLSPRGAVETLILLLAVWGAWIHIAWTTNYFDLSTRLVRLALLGVMLVSLVMSASIPAAFAERGLGFAAALVALGGWTLFLLAAIGRDHHLSAVFGRVLVWEVTCGVLWLAGGLAQWTVRFALWLAATAVMY
ncbi:MAG: low temperature requirement protein A, partial [Thermomicrobiales bacterium]